MSKKADPDQTAATKTAVDPVAAIIAADPVPDAPAPDAPAPDAPAPDAPAPDAPVPDAPAPDAPAPDAPVLNLSLLNHLIHQIALFNNDGHRLALITELTEMYGMSGEPTDEAKIVLEMAGVTIDPADDMRTALDNWANAARRAIMQAVGAPVADAEGGKA